MSEYKFSLSNMKYMFKCARCGKPCYLYNFTLLGVKKGKYIGYCKECERKLERR